MRMDKQLSLSALSDELSQVRTKKREFLAEIDRIVPLGEMDQHYKAVLLQWNQAIRYRTEIRWGAFGTF